MERAYVPRHVDVNEIRELFDGKLRTHSSTDWKVSVNESNAYGNALFVATQICLPVDRKVPTITGVS